MKEGHIFIYGEIIPWQDDDASYWGGVNLKDVNKQIQNNKDAEKLIVHINSMGGSVYEGMGIHDVIKNSGKEVEVIIEGLCASIATVIAMSGKTVKMTQNSTFMIHNPWTYVEGDSVDLKKEAEELERIENQLADIYLGKVNISREDVLKYMHEETFFDSDKALELGFIDEIVTNVKAVAKLYNNKNREKMSKENEALKAELQETQSKLEKSEGLIAKFKALFSGGGAKALLLQDSAGIELDFFELEEGATPQVGDKANVEGSPAEGEYVMPDGATYVFAAGELTEIREADSGEEMEALKEENAALKEEIETLKNEAETTTTALAQLKDEALTQSKEFEETITELKASIKNLDTEIKKGEPLKDDEPITIRSAYKQKS